MNKTWYTKHTWPVNFTIFPPGFFQQKKGTEPESQEIIFLYEKLHAFYTAILMSCYYHDINNIKESRNLVTWPQKI